MPKQLYYCLFSVFLIVTVPSAGAYDGYDGSYMASPPASMERPTNAPPAYATPRPQKSESYGTTISKKLGAGLSNMALGFLEIPKNIVNTSNEVNFAMGITGGVLKGVLYAGGRTICGIVDFLSFPAPTEPLTTPQFVWMHFPQETRFNPAFKLKQ